VWQRTSLTHTHEKKYIYRDSNETKTPGPPLLTHVAEQREEWGGTVAVGGSVSERAVSSIMFGVTTLPLPSHFPSPYAQLFHTPPPVIRHLQLYAELY
jgi:hypothetical protein